MARRKRRLPRKKYQGKFVGITKTLLESFRDGIDPEPRRTRAFYLFCHLLIYGTWNFHDPSTPFVCSFRTLMEKTGWSHRRIRDSALDLHKARIVTRRRSMLRGRAITYKADCEKLGFRRKEERSRSKQDKPYKDQRFWGMTKLFLENLRKKTLLQQRHVKQSDEVWTTGDVRIKSLWLFAHILVYGGWKVNAPDQPFSVSLRRLMKVLGWSINTVRKYRDILASMGALDVVSPGGRGIAASYSLNCAFAAILDVPAKNPTKVVDLEKAKAASTKGEGKEKGDENKPGG